MVQSLLWSPLYPLPLLRAGSVGVLPCSTRGHVKLGGRLRRLGLSYHGPGFFGCVRAAVLRATATVGVDLWHGPYLFRFY